LAKKKNQHFDVLVFVRYTQNIIMTRACSPSVHCLKKVALEEVTELSDICINTYCAGWNCAGYRKIF